MKYPFSKKQTLIGGGLSLFAFIFLYGTTSVGEPVNRFLSSIYLGFSGRLMCFKAIDSYNDAVMDWMILSDMKNAGWSEYNEEGFYAKVDKAEIKNRATESNYKSWCNHD